MNSMPSPILERSIGEATDYDIVFVRAPRHGDNQQTILARSFSPVRAESGSDLMAASSRWQGRSPDRFRGRFHHRPFCFF